MKKPRRTLLAVGANGTGKSSLLHTLKSGAFPESWFLGVVRDAEIVDVQVTGHQAVELHIWTSNGDSDYKQLRPLSYPSADVFLLCYAVDDPQSFYHIQDIYVPEINEHGYSYKPKILVGTKLDTRPADLSDLKPGKFVTFEQGQQLSTTIGAAAFIECAAKNGVNLPELLMASAELAMRSRKKQKCKCVLC